MQTLTPTKTLNQNDNLEQNFYTPEQYLELEEKSELKHEYRNGEIVTMSGGTTDHNEIASNLCTYLKLALKGKKYRVFIADVRLWIPNFNLYTYPDLMVVEGEPIYHGQGKRTITNPKIIVEVLSKSTQDYDRGTKFNYYRSIPSFQEYLLIDQYSYSIEKFAKNSANQWVLTDYQGENTKLCLDSLNFEFNLLDIYENVDFTQH